MKYTVSDSTLQYKVGLTLSFLSLISRGIRGVGPFQKGTVTPLNLACVRVACCLLSLRDANIGVK